MSESEFAKTHLRDHLSTLIIPHVADGFWSIYKTSKELCERNNQQDQILRTFQNMLTKIPEWNDVTIKTEVERIVKVSKCSYLDDLIMGVFIAYMKSFASLHYRGNSNHIQIDFDRPDTSRFIHELYIQSARKLWQVAYLFKTFGVTNEQQARNRQEVSKILLESIENVIRHFLPWESIAKQFSEQQTPEPIPSSNKRVVFEDAESEDENDEEMEEEAPPPSLKILEDVASIDIDTFDEEETDPLKEIELKAESNPLVLKL